MSNLSLADFIAPSDTKKEDFLGFFTVTAGLGIEKLIKQYEADHDDYKIIMVKALADRLAEAAAEYLHEIVRKDYWGYSVNESFSNEELIEERYKDAAC